MHYISHVIPMEILCFTKIHIHKATVNRKESYTHKSWKLEIVHRPHVAL